MSFIQNFDNQIILFLNSLGSNVIIDNIMKFISFLGNKGWFYIVVGLVMIMFIKRYPYIGRWGLILLFSLLISTIIVNVLIKPIIQRDRPFDTLLLDLIINRPNDYSFPSGHTTAAFGAAIVFLYINKKIGYIMLIFAIFMGFSRMYLLVHYFTDVLFGALIGSIISIIVCKFYIKSKYYDKKSVD